MIAIIIVLVVVALVLALAIGGYVAMGRRTSAGEAGLLEQLQRAELELAKAHAADKGWDRATLEAAARAVAEVRFGVSEVDQLQLVHVIDKPGTDADQAVFRVLAAGEERSITLGRTGGAWGPAD